MTNLKIWETQQAGSHLVFKGSVWAQPLVIIALHCIGFRSGARYPLAWGDPWTTKFAASSSSVFCLTWRIMLAIVRGF